MTVRNGRRNWSDTPTNRFANGPFDAGRYLQQAESKGDSNGVSVFVLLLGVAIVAAIGAFALAG